MLISSQLWELKMSQTPQGIILNGLGSVGKMSTAQALQEIADRNFLHVAMDVFLEIMPKRMFGHPNDAFTIFRPVPSAQIFSLALLVSPLL